MNSWTKAFIITDIVITTALLVIVVIGLLTDCPNTANYVKCGLGFAWG